MVGHEYEYEVDDDGPGGSVETKPLIDVPKIRAPPDRKYIVFFIFAFLGLASLLPWNFFITAKNYFDYKLRNTSLSSNVSYDDPDHSTQLQVEFESNLSIVSNGFNMMFSIFAVIIAKRVSVKKRIVGASLFILLMFAATTTMVKVNTDSWQTPFLIFTLSVAALMSGAQSVLCGSVLGLSATFPSLYSQSAMMGQAAGGTFATGVSILTFWAGGDAISSAFVYFFIASGVTVLAIVFYISLRFLKFAKYYMTPIGTAVKDLNNDYQVTSIQHHKLMFFWIIFKKTWLFNLSIMLVFYVTLSVFPAVGSSIKTEYQDNPTWSAYFTLVACFLLFNVGDLLGRILTFAVKIPGNNQPVAMLVLCTLRLAFIPLLMMCNAQPRHHIPVYLDKDAYPITLILLMGLSNGYLSTLCMSYGPVHVDESEMEVAGMMLAFSMTVGLALGSFSSSLYQKLL